MDADRLRKLARHVDSLAHKDRERIRREQEIEILRREAAAALYALCRDFVRQLNTVLTSGTLELSPAEFCFRESADNLIQIHINGRVIQLHFSGTEPLLCTENLRLPYTLEGSIRWYNQEMIERDEISDHNLYYCVDRRGSEWRYVDHRTHRSGEINEEYLADLLEQLV